jgi:hypothetical protein
MKSLKEIFVGIHQQELSGITSLSWLVKFPLKIQLNWLGKLNRLTEVADD